MSDAPCSLQVVIDCESPHHLAAWWAETLGWQVEPQDETFIKSMIEQGHATEAETTIHNGALVWVSGAAIEPADPTGSAQPRLLFQHVPEPKTLKNRIHLDLRPAARDANELVAMRERLVERGATEIGGGQQGPHTWVTYADPEGNEFCI